MQIFLGEFLGQQLRSHPAGLTVGREERFGDWQMANGMSVLKSNFEFDLPAVSVLASASKIIPKGLK